MADFNLSYSNNLLRRLDQSDLALIEPDLSQLSLPVRYPLESAQAPTEFVYFLEDGIASIVARMARGRDTEVGLIGFEGMTGSSVILGDDRPIHECYMQFAGSGHRLPVGALAKAIAQSSTLHRFLLRFVHALQIQTAYTALSNARARLEERAARWLLMCDDRIPGNKLTITHEFLGIMLGVRRPGVTVAIQSLEGRGFIRAYRGEIIIRDREGLVAFADGGYTEPKAQYERLIGKYDHSHETGEAAPRSDN